MSSRGGYPPTPLTPPVPLVIAPGDDVFFLNISLASGESFEVPVPVKSTVTSKGEPPVVQREAAKRELTARQAHELIVRF